MTEEIPWPRKSGRLFKSDSDWWHNACLNYPGIDIEAYAIGYKQAADCLVEYVSQERRFQDTLVYPIAFLYRQYLELRLKELIRSGNILLGTPNNMRKPDHRIDKYWEQCRKVLEKIWPNEKTDDLDAIAECIKDFSKVDPTSTGFRYPVNTDGRPSLKGITHINLRNLAEVMNRIASPLDAAGTGIDVMLDQKREMESWYKE
jgi:hypothetical protein